MTTLGAIFPPWERPEDLRDVARAAEDAGLEQLWVWEDCFAESGIAAAAAALAWTDRLTIGIGLLPVPLRNVALTAMEIATLERLFPGRLVAGIGHGVPDWMGQVGARADSPMTLLREYVTALRALLHGETVTTSARYVHLDNVTLTWPPQSAPPLLIGAVGPRTVALAGELGDGVILTSETSAERLPAALAQFDEGRRRSGGESRGEVLAFVHVPGGEPARRSAERVQALADAGVTHAMLACEGDDRPPLTEFVAHIATQIAPLVQ